MEYLYLCLRLLLSDLNELRKWQWQLKHKLARKTLDSLTQNLSGLYRSRSQEQRDKTLAYGITTLVRFIFA